MNFADETGEGKSKQSLVTNKTINFLFSNINAYLFSSTHKLQFPQGLMKPRGIPRRINFFQTGQAGNKTRLLIGKKMFLEILFYYCLFFTEHAKTTPCNPGKFIFLSYVKEPLNSKLQLLQITGVLKAYRNFLVNQNRHCARLPQQ